MLKKNNIFNKERNINKEFHTRNKKLEEIKKNKIAFPNNFKRNFNIKELYNKYNKEKKIDLEKLNIKVKISGRIISRRIMGKASFINIQDMDGNIQLYIKCNNISLKEYNEKFKKLDIGDIIGVHGFLFKTNTNMLSINCFKIFLLTKSLRPLPNKFNGLIEKEIKYRKRYLDLISNKNSKKIFKLRSKIIHEIRLFMRKENFIEVETPMMHSIPGGASANPFITYNNSLKMNMYLRISPELYLKRLIIGGFEKIFEINRSFRNEGISTRHNPEFTMLELYIAYSDYIDLMKLTKKFLISLMKNIFGNTVLRYNKYIIDLKKSFCIMTMIEAICHYYPHIKTNLLNNKEYAIEIAKSFNIKINKKWGLGKIQNEIFSKTTEKYLINPTFITEYPVEVSPLARTNDKNSFVTDRFEFFICGYEIANGFSELNDPEEQKKRFLDQVKYKEDDDKSNYMFYDKEYLTALEYGLPPTAGLGIGIDRLIMLLSNSNTIKDVILFPALKNSYKK